MSTTPHITTQLFTAEIPSTFRHELLPSSKTNSNHIATTSPIDYSAPDALQQVFASLPIISNECYQHIATSLSEPIELLRQGETVAFPTETVFGLGADARNTNAVSKIYEAKGRPSDNPLIVHVASIEQVEELTSPPISPLLSALIHRFWPGPLSIIIRHRHNLSEKATAGLSTVALRMPNHPLAYTLIKASQCPTAAPSSNTSGKPSPTTAQHVLTDLSGKITSVVDGLVTLIDPNTHKPVETINLNCQYGLESTVIDISHLGVDDTDDILSVLAPQSAQSAQTSLSTRSTPLIYILRPGSITKSDLEQLVGHGNVSYDPTLKIAAPELHTITDTTGQNSLPQNTTPNVTTTTTSSTTLCTTNVQPKAPGMKYTHYAPKAPVYLATSAASFCQQLSVALHQNQRVGLLCTVERLNETIEYIKQQQLESIYETNCVARPCGHINDLQSVATNLYDNLRAFDDLDPAVDVIYAEMFDHSELGAAVMDRLIKAAGGRFI